MEVVAPLVGYIEFDGNGAFHLHSRIHIRGGPLLRYRLGSRAAGTSKPAFVAFHDTAYAIPPTSKLVGILAVLV